MLAAIGLGVGALGRRVQAASTYYQYDSLSRLTAVIAADGSASTYVFDKAGNRKALQIRRYVSDAVTGDGFDPKFYNIINPDVARAGVDPYGHYMSAGWHEGRDPNGYFSTLGYLNAYTDVAAAGVNPLQHYMQYGWHEGRNPSGLFNTRKYLAAYSDIAAAGINPFLHYLKNGAFEGRSPFGDGTY
ncbi:hypothetical protein [Nitrospirillum viridazoti]|uniref:hypothetical protein n=1 Tax=Nitrospirillum viridazoti TaxID=3144925 RepID=UPI00110F80BB|nr:hypothetical protein [Nitrospirillum amazonense]